MLTTYDNLQNFFHTSITSALSNQSVTASDHTKIYIVNLLTRYSRAENLFEETRNGTGIRPLTEYYQGAIYTQSKLQQFKFLRRLGDIALFISGIFSGSLCRRNIGPDFYVAMGGNAYSHLSEIYSSQQTIKAHQQAFHEIGHNFIAFVDILAEIGDQMHTTTNIDLLKQYDIWLKTGNKHAGRLLKRSGIDLNTLPVSNYKH